MHINIDKLTSVNGKCETCNNKDICKYSSDYKRILEEVSEIKIEFGSPVNIATNCMKYQKLPQKQDGFYGR